MAGTTYDDGRIRCDGDALVIEGYYFPRGAKRIAYDEIRTVTRLPLGRGRRWRIWGSGDFVHWWNLDPTRPRKDAALVLDTGHHWRPTITPDDPAAVEAILTARTG